jgi:hypothetical protein
MLKSVGCDPVFWFIVLVVSEIYEKQTTTEQRFYEERKESRTDRGGEIVYHGVKSRYPQIVS